MKQSKEKDQKERRKLLFLCMLRAVFLLILSHLIMYCTDAHILRYEDALLHVYDLVLKAFQHVIFEGILR